MSLTIAVLSWMLGCASEPTVACPEATILQDVRPVTGGRTVWCERKNGTREGPWLEYRDGGDKAAEGRFERGRRQGRFTWWHPNGAVREESDYVDGKLDGAHVTYDAEGAVLARESWVAGKKAD